MRVQVIRSIAAAAVAFVIAGWNPVPARAQGAGQESGWNPPRLADGQPDIQGMWNNVGAVHTPLELPDAFDGRVPTEAELTEFIQGRSDARKAVTWQGFEHSGGVGAYANYWFDWFWEQPVVDAPALVVDPPTGRVPALTPEALASVAYHREHLHDSYDTMESGDRCVSRGVFGMMMPTAYNNGTLIVQAVSYTHLTLPTKRIV